VQRPLHLVLTGAGVLVAIAVVAVASRGSTPAGEAGTRGPADTFYDILFTLYLILLVVGAIFFVYVLALQRKMRSQAGVEPRRLSMVVLAFLLLVGFVGARRLQGLELEPPPEQEAPIVTQTPGALPGATTTPEVDAYEPGFAWIPALVFVALLAVGGGAVWWASARRRRAHLGAEPAALGEALADVLEETLDDLRAERDPRRAVIAAYARLERVLAAHGIPRRPADAPVEYLSRVLDDLSVSPGAVGRLTLLFERAKFSHHEVEAGMKDEAIAALQTMQDELRAAEALAQQERERAARLASDRVRAAR